LGIQVLQQALEALGKRFLGLEISSQTIRNIVSEDFKSPFGKGGFRGISGSYI
jgi:hypothetical protein